MEQQEPVEMQKITVEVPADVLQRAKDFVDGGTSDAVREGLERLSRIQAFRELKKLRGTIKFSPSLEEMRSWEEDDPDNPWNPGHGEA